MGALAQSAHEAELGRCVALGGLDKFWRNGWAGGTGKAADQDKDNVSTRTVGDSTTDEQNKKKRNS